MHTYLVEPAEQGPDHVRMRYSKYSAECHIRIQCSEDQMLVHHEPDKFLNTRHELFEMGIMMNSRCVLCGTLASGLG